jgi:DNA-binding NtrC family response regulator
MGFRKVPPLAVGAMERISTYHWPGNVRELENAVERALILSRGEPLIFSELPFPSSEKSEPLAWAIDAEVPNLDVVISKHIREVLKMTEGRVEGKGGAAELLGVNPGTLRHRMRKLGIPFGRVATKGKYKKIM